MAKSNTLDQLRHSPALFRENLVLKSAHGPTRFGVVMAEFQRIDFAALDAGFIAVANGKKPPIGRYWIERTKGGSKDSDLCVMLLWLLKFASTSVRIQVGAYDQDQAAEIRLIATEILRQEGPLNEALAQDIEVTRDEIRNRHMGSMCELLTTDSHGTHGSRPTVTFLNELSHITDEAFASTMMDNSDKTPVASW